MDLQYLRRPFKDCSLSNSNFQGYSLETKNKVLSNHLWLDVPPKIAEVPKKNKNALVALHAYNYQNHLIQLGVDTKKGPRAAFVGKDGSINVIEFANSVETTKDPEITVSQIYKFGQNIAEKPPGDDSTQSLPPSGAAFNDYFCISDGEGNTAIFKYDLSVKNKYELVVVLGIKNDTSEKVSSSPSILRPSSIVSFYYNPKKELFRLMTWSFNDNSNEYNKNANNTITVSTWKYSLKHDMYNKKNNEMWDFESRVNGPWYPALGIIDDDETALFASEKPFFFDESVLLNRSQNGENLSYCDINQDSNADKGALLITPPIEEKPYYRDIERDSNVDKYSENKELCKPYIWMQKYSDIDISLKLDTNINTRDIVCNFKNDRIICKLLYNDYNNESIVAKTLLKDTQLFDEIIPRECVWYVEDNNVLSLLLCKANPDLRWPHIFKEDDYVDETMDPLVFHSALRQLGKYTSDEIVNEACQPTFSVSGEKLEQVDIDKGYLHMYRLKTTTPYMSNGCGMVIDDQKLLQFIPSYLVESDNKKYLSKAAIVLGDDFDANTFQFELSHDDCSFSFINLHNYAAISYIRRSKMGFKYTLFSDELVAIVEHNENIFLYIKPKNSQMMSKQFVEPIPELSKGKSSVIGSLLHNHTLFILLESSVIVMQLYLKNINHNLNIERFSNTPLEKCGHSSK